MPALHRRDPTCRESADHAPIEWGLFRAYSLTAGGDAPIRVALAQHRVDRAALDLS